MEGSFLCKALSLERREAPRRVQGGPPAAVPFSLDAGTGRGFRLITGVTCKPIAGATILVTFEVCRPAPSNSRGIDAARLGFRVWGVRVASKRWLRRNLNLVGGLLDISVAFLWYIKSFNIP